MVQVFIYGVYKSTVVNLINITDTINSSIHEDSEQHPHFIDPQSVFFVFS